MGSLDPVACIMFGGRHDSSFDSTNKYGDKMSPLHRSPLFVRLGGERDGGNIAHDANYGSS